MSPEMVSIFIAVITGLCTAVPSIITTIHTNKVRDAVQDAQMRELNDKIEEQNDKIDRLTEKVEKYNDIDKRLAIIENIVFRRGEQK